ncbi:MAG TPA: hypothetical protein VK549_04230 [Acidimicrobiia bacterium]|nr:hypothetical protein [Acidimicrobiia bacterium]
MEPNPPSCTNARRRRARRRALTSLVAVLVVAVALASCSGGDDEKAATTTTTTKAREPKTKVNMTLGDVSAASAGAPVTIAADQSQHVLDTLTTYVQDATVQPLRTGKPATADLGAVFDANTLASATTTDRGILIDEGLPQVTGDLTVTGLPVGLVGLGDQSGNLILITAALAVDATGATKVKGAAPVHILRKANFTLQPDATGAWKITAYDVLVARDGTELSPTSTSGAATTTGAKK